MDSFDSKNMERRQMALLLLVMIAIIVIVCLVSSYFIRNAGTNV